MQDRRGKWLRWLARAVGAFVAGFWPFIGVLSAIGGDEPWTYESTIMALLTIAAVVAVMVAWRREGLGGTLLLLVGVAHLVSAGLAMASELGPTPAVGVLSGIAGYVLGRGGRGGQVAIRL